MTTKAVDLAILGTGHVGQAIAKRLTQCDISYVFGSRTPELAPSRLDPCFQGAPCLSFAQAIQQGELILLAIPWRGLLEQLASLAPRSGSIFIDCVNPLNERFDGLVVQGNDSAAEQIARAMPGVHIVKALNTVSTELMENPHCLGPAATMFYCGDDLTAKAQVHRLLQRMGFAPCDAGPLRCARYLESMAMLTIELAMRGGMGSRMAIQLLRSTSH